MEDKYAVNDKVFAKLKGFPPWPAKIMERAAGKEEKYLIIFYGSHDEAIVKLDQIFIFNETTKAKYGKPSRKALFKEAMAEIEADVENGEGGIDNLEEGEPTTTDGNNQGDNAKEVDSEGELMIDEGPSLPPVLKREIQKSDIQVVETVGNKATANKRQRTVSKRDSLTTASPVAPVTTPTTPDGSQPGTEIVSRSGRKIKPKRFADEEVTTGGRTRGKSSTGPADEGSQPPASKKAKRGSVSTTPVTPLKTEPEDVSEPPPSLKLKATPTKGKAAAAVATTSARLSPPDISSDISKGPPILKAVPKRGAAAAAGNKTIPSLEPSPATTHSKTVVQSGPAVRKSERQTRSNSIEEKTDEVPSLEEEEEEPDTDAPQCSRASELDVEESEVDKENSNGEHPNQELVPVANNNNAQSDDDSKFVKPRPKDYVQAPPSNMERKIRVSTKNGLKIELSFDAKSPDGWNAEQWQATATQNVRKVIEDLKEGDVESQELINSAADLIPSGTVAETKSREKLSSQLRLLRVEGEVIEIIGEIVGCLGVNSADCIRAMDLLDRLQEHNLNPLMLKKHPEVVYTIQKLRTYVGNIDAWGFTEDQRDEFEIFAQEIRRKSKVIFNHFQELFGIDPSSEMFGEIFQEEVRKFKDQVDELPLKQMLGLTEENGELHELAMSLNGDMEFDDTQE